MRTLYCQHQDFLIWTTVKFNLNTYFADQEDLVTGKTVSHKDASANVYHSTSHCKVSFDKNYKIWFSNIINKRLKINLAGRICSILSKTIIHKVI